MRAKVRLGPESQRSTPIKPQFDFRFSIEEIKASYASGDAAFEDGAYLLAAEFAEPDSELEGCALVLGGSLGRGLTILKRSQSLSARGLVCKAFAEWSLGQDEIARSTLGEVPEGTEYSARAKAFRALIDKPEITVFVIAAFLPVPSIAGTSGDGRIPVQRYGRFNVKYVGTQLQDNAYEYELHQPFDEFIDSLPKDERPDFLFAQTPQWIPPLNFEKVAIPKIIWCHDGDVFIYRAIDNYSLYDVRICLTSQEHFEMRHSIGGFCVENLMSDPLNTEFPQFHVNPDKKFDILFTGGAFDFFHSEKARFIYQLSELADTYKIAVVDGYLPRDEYHKMLSEAKFLPVVSRNAGNPTPRWRDALANSAYVLYPAGAFYGKAFPGCFSYRTASIADDIRHHLESYDANDPAYALAQRTAEIDSEMAIFRAGRQTLFERQLKFAAFSVLIMRPPKAIPPRAHGRRLAWVTPPIDGGIYGAENIRKKMARVADATSEPELRDEHDFNNLAHIYSQLALTFPEAPGLEIWKSKADHFFARGCERYPSSLLLAFNRAQWAFFRDGDGSAEAARQFRKLLDRWDLLEFEPLGADIGMAYTLPYRDQIFPYYEYAHLVTRYGARHAAPSVRSPDIAAIRTVVKAACLGYLGWEAIRSGNIKVAFEHLRGSLRLYPTNLPLSRFFLEHLLSFKEKAGAASLQMHEACDVFLACVNQYPAILLSHTHRLAEIFRRTGRESDLRDVLASWYRLGNITYSTQPSQRLEHELDRFVEICRFADAFPEALTKKLTASASGPSDKADFTQFERMIVAATKVDASLNGPVLAGMPYRSKRLTTRFRASALRSRARIRRKLTNLVISGLRRFSWYGTFYEAYMCARLGKSLSMLENPSRFQAIVFGLTLRLRGTKPTI